MVFCPVLSPGTRIVYHECFNVVLQDMVVRREQFQHKQRVLQEALARGDALIAQRRRAALSTCLTGWRHVSGIYKIVAQRFASLQHHSLAGIIQQWRRYTAAKVTAACSLFHQLLCAPCMPVWRETLQH